MTLKFKSTHRSYVDVFFYAVCVTHCEVASDSQVGRSQIKGHSDGRPFLLDFNMFGVPV